YVTERRLPDSAIDLMDEAAALQGGSGCESGGSSMYGWVSPTSGFIQLEEELRRAVGADAARGLRPLEPAPPRGPPPGTSGDRGEEGGPGAVARGRQSREEVRQQQLLEWFGATPAQAKGGVEGQLEMVRERRRRHAELFGGSPGSSSSVDGAAGEPAWDEDSALAAERAQPKACPHCGTSVPTQPAPGGTNTASCTDGDVGCGTGSCSSSSSSSSGGSGGGLFVDERAVLDVVSRATGLPLEAVLRDHFGAPVRHLRTALEARLVGQRDAVRAVCTAIQLHRLGLAAATAATTAATCAASLSPPSPSPPLRSSSRPVASFLLVGPAGCGKSTLCQALAEELFHDPAALLVLHGGEYGSRTSVARLVGAAPGYVGYGSGGLLTEALRRRPHCVLLVQEVDKAHYEVQELLRRGLQEGDIRDGQGRSASLRNAVVVFTTTTTTTTTTAAAAAAVHTRAIQEGRQAGDAATSEAGAGIATSGAAATAADWSATAGAYGIGGSSSNLVPELWTSVDRIVHFHPLDEQQRTEVIKRQVDELAAQLRPAGVAGIEVEPSAAAWLAGLATAAAGPPSSSPLTRPAAGHSGYCGGMAGSTDLLRRQLLEPLAEMLVEGAEAQVGPTLVQPSFSDDVAAAEPRRGVVSGDGVGRSPYYGGVPRQWIVRVKLNQGGPSAGGMEALALELVELLGRRGPDGVRAIAGGGGDDGGGDSRCFRP
ncbi:hypothetical protein VOLCADRAFT_115945, partial [Volvox carteri f. nagariensis]